MDRKIKTMNPSSRDETMEDFERYCNDAPAVLKVAKEIATVLIPGCSRTRYASCEVEISTILRDMAKTPRTHF